MFCPSCKGEFRQGFSRCERCNVDLVEELASEKPTRPSPPAVIRVVDYCGFLALDEARAARDRLREQLIAADIVIRDSPDAGPGGTVGEEYWLRVDHTRVREVREIVGDFEIPEADEAEGDFKCGECGHLVAAEESFCPGCGARFDEP